MSDSDEQVCPLCCEELDISDQNFLPCKCGYQARCGVRHENSWRGPKLSGRSARALRRRKGSATPGALALTAAPAPLRSRRELYTTIFGNKGMLRAPFHSKTIPAIAGSRLDQLPMSSISGVEPKAHSTEAMPDVASA